MADRRVTATGKNKEGDITSLCNSGQSWSPRYSNDAINDIEQGTHSYYVQQGATHVDIHVVDDPSGKYLRTDPDQSEGNNLDDLPNC